MRERLADETRLLLVSRASAGVLTAERRTHEGWDAGLVDLHLDTGELVAKADRSGAITLGRFGVGVLPIELPEAVFERPARMVDVRAALVAPVHTRDVAWNGDDAATVRAELALEMAWALEVDGGRTPLGMPRLPPVPVEIDLTGDGFAVHAELRVRAPGELWSWAGLVKLRDLTLVLAAATPAPL
ncbi:MAG: hypothetical protein KF773_11755 [Deltaproteobacteria bacterium]|nr:hypothetical protein [Deltaproteobacteria bacterium]MCW5806952.1 hypothetical protein [Deltaproteobacteria bacterium]